MKNMLVRKATGGDTLCIEKLLQQLGYTVNVTEAQLRNMAVFDDGEVKGVIAWFERQSLLQQKVHIHIEALVVDEHCRGMGIGTQLLNFVQPHNCEAIIDLVSGGHRKKTHLFYQKHGFTCNEKFYFRKLLS